ncbi:MAG: C39 family peptidase [Anaerolineae bacterium]|nr:C39 family peptidase [Anaerolineae bacterium]
MGLLRRGVVVLVVLLVVLLPARAQETNAVTLLPDTQHLTGFTMYLQELNRCSAAALAIHLSYFRDYFPDDYWVMKRRLNPSFEDVSVRIEEMVEVAQEYGLNGIVRRGGTLELLKQLVAGGFPVLIENAIYEGNDAFRDWMSHNRVVTGFDDNTGEIFFWDPSLGNGPDDLGIRLPYDQLDERWRPFNRNYLVIYRPQDEERLKTILGPQWDAAYNAQWTLEQAEADRAAGKLDSFTTYNIGWAQLQLGDYAAAAAAFDEARAVGLPWRFFWYDFSVFEAWNALGRYDDMLRLVHETIQRAPGVEELYYYAALAYEGNGNTERALLNLQAALSRHPRFTAAQAALTRLQGG